MAQNGGYYAKGGKMENMYKIVDIDGDTVESNLNEQEVIDFADSLGYYEAQDNEEEPIYDIDSAISLIEMEGDYTVVKMSEYGGSVYADGGEVDMNEVEKSAKFYTDDSKWSTKPSIEKFQEQLDESSNLLRKLENKEITPSKIIGGGLKSPSVARKIALNYLETQIAIFKRSIEILKERGAKYAKGGAFDEINVGDEVVWKGNKYKFAKITNDVVRGLRDTKYHLYSYKVGVDDAILDSLKGVTKYESVKGYAKGGKVAKFDAYEVAGELAELADGVWDKLGITDGGMLYNDESLQAKVNEEYAKAGIDEMFKALSTVNRKKVAEALTDENNHNVRNYLALRGYLGVAEKRSYTKLFKKSGKFKIFLNPTIFGVKPLVSDISTYVPHSKVLSITIKKGDKEYKLTGNDILDGVYVKDGEFKRGGVMKTLRRWWKKLNGTWYYNEGAGWRRDRKFQNKSEKYEKDGRKTYKQVTRGYVDDMPYEYAKGGKLSKIDNFNVFLKDRIRFLSVYRWVDLFEDSEFVPLELAYKIDEYEKYYRSKPRYHVLNKSELTKFIKSFEEIGFTCDIVPEKITEYTYYDLKNLRPINVPVSDLRESPDDYFDEFEYDTPEESVEVFDFDIEYFVPKSVKAILKKADKKFGLYADLIGIKEKEKEYEDFVEKEVNALGYSYETMAYSAYATFTTSIYLTDYTEYFDNYSDFDEEDRKEYYIQKFGLDVDGYGDDDDDYDDDDEDGDMLARGGYVDMREKLTKELMKLQRELNSSRLNSYFEGDTSEAEMARRRERESKLARFNDILKTLNEMDKSPKYAKGGDVTVPEKIDYSSMFASIPRSTDNEKVV